MELRIIGMCLTRPEELESEAKRRIEERMAKIDAEWKEHVLQLRKLLKLNELPSVEEFAKLSSEKKKELLAAEQGFLEIAAATFMIRKGPASFGGIC